MIIFGTAGHIDHGKTSLIYALTNINADRLPEEKSRGMTIDLGFAWMETLQREKIGIIDVPGHENFIRNMIIGITSADAFILVVDAKEGWKPQTEEHFQIINLLEIKYGLIALTKTDLVSEQRLKIVKQEIEEIISSLNKPDIPILYFSNKDTDSISQLRIEMEKISNSIPPKADIDKPRMFIDRIFEIKGSGTVVTGSLLNGNLFQNQFVYHFPSLKKLRLRQIQSYNDTVNEAIIGSRVALNLTGLKKDDIKRGDLIFTNPELPFGNMLDLSVVLIPQKKNFQLKNGTELEFISHTKILRGTIFFKQKEIGAGERFFAQIRFAEPISLMVGDYFIIRLPGINETIGGGRILDTHSSRYKFYNSTWKERLIKIAEFDINQMIIGELIQYKAIKKESLLPELPYSRKEIELKLQELSQQGLIILKEDWIINIDFWNDTGNQVISMLEQKHKDDPLKEGFPIIYFKNKLSAVSEDLFLYLLNDLSKVGKIVVKKGIISSANHAILLSDQQNRLIEKMIDFIEKDSSNLPTEEELKTRFPNDRELIRYLVEQKRIIKLDEQILITPAIYKNMKEAVIDYLRENNTITIGEVRDLLHISRKYIIPLLTRMDEEGITIRKGNERVLRR